MKIKIDELPKNTKKVFLSFFGRYDLLYKIITKTKNKEESGYVIAILCYLILGEYDKTYEIKYYIEVIKAFELMNKKIEVELMPYIFGEEK